MAGYSGPSHGFTPFPFKYPFKFALSASYTPKNDTLIYKDQRCDPRENIDCITRDGEVGCMYIYTSPYVRTRDRVVYRKIEFIVPKLLESLGFVRYGAN